MTYEEIAQQLVNAGQNPDDYKITVLIDGFSVEPLSTLEPRQIAKQEIKPIVEQTKINIEQAKREAEIRQRINNGEITASTFSNLTVEDQELTKLVLFKQYSPSQEQIPRSLSAIEFLLVVTIKLLDKSIDRTTLTTEENSFFDSLVTMIGKNDMPINDTTDWRFQYADTEFTNVQNNRTQYFTEKQNVTGSV